MFKSPAATSVIKWLSAGAFSVYLLHSHPLFIRHIVEGKMQFLSSIHFILRPFVCMALTGVIFIVAVGIDSLRRGICKSVKKISLLK